MKDRNKRVRAAGHGRGSQPKLRKKHTTNTTKWPDEARNVLRERLWRLYESGGVTDVDAGHTIPLGWTPTGVAAWKSYVDVMANGDERAAATAIITGVLKNQGWLKLCEEVDIEIQKESKAKGIGAGATEVV